MKKRGKNRLKLVCVSLTLFALAGAIITLLTYTNLKQEITGRAIFLQSDIPVVVTVNFSEEIGIIRGDFYGVNVHNFLSDSLKVDSNGDGLEDNYSDIEWHRQKFLESGMKYIRDDMGLGNYYFYDEWANLDFENWTNKNVGFFNSPNETGTAGWKVSVYDGATGFVSQSTDNHSENYSLNVSCNQSSHVYVYRGAGLTTRKDYNFSVWVKTNGTISILIQRLDNYQSCGSTTFSGNGTEWKQVSVSCNNITYSGYRIVIDGINKDESVLIDDANLTENNGIYLPSYFFSGNLSSKTDRLKWAKENSIKVLAITDYMPPWLADTSVEGCNKSELRDCIPYNMEIWKEIVIDYLDRVTENGAYDNLGIEVWNEPYGDSFLSELPYDSPTKNDYYNELYNATYHAIKEKYPNIAVGGPSGFYEAPNMLNGFLSNFPQQMDFVSVHPYLDKYESNTNGIYNKTEWLLDLCKNYNANCSRIINSEWNVANVLIKNSTENHNRFGANIALAYMDILNNWPSNVSMMLYQWSENKGYSPLTNYPSYPQLWSMVSEPWLDNEVYPPYNVTKNFATYHSAGSMVVNSTGSSNIRVVASKKEDNSQYITLINTGNETNVSLSIINNISSSFKDLETGEIYTLNNGIAELTIGQYEITYLESYNIPDTPPTLPPETPVPEEGEEGEYITEVTEENKSNETNESVINDSDRPTKIEDYKEAVENESEPISGKVAGTGSVILEEKGEVIWKGMVVFLFVGIIAVSSAILHVYFRHKHKTA